MRRGASMTISATGGKEIKASRRTWPRVEGAKDRSSSPGGERRESRANYSMAVFGYSMRSIKETESERETREERGKEEEIDRERPEQKIPAGSADRLDWD